ncbi:LAQU0S05e05930g1_1 [Lachancea quebecensis]|uniref:LAQU0S05e05930g1_1 n=1 Tax=Lachancea quebecensis TaxID=1654605 RepID=A0A0N7MLJ5_9SACH|nr:LAQU0S05e05930g1_1 [Lachancea quebecensis]
MTSGTLRATFWSEDYTSGIAVLLSNIDNDVSELKEFIETVETFDNKTIGPAIKSLESLVRAIPSKLDNGSISSRLQQQRKELLTEILGKLQVANRSNLETACLSQLQALLFEFEEYQQESKELIEKNFELYSKHLALAKRVQGDVTTRAQRIREASQKPLPRNEEVSLSSEEEIDHTEEEPRDRFPLKLGAKLSFSNEESFFEFCDKLKKLTKTSKRLIYIPGVSNEYFSSLALFESLKRIEPRMDASLYNLERLGQNLIDNGVISPYNGMLGAKVKFARDGYYVWGENSSPVVRPPEGKPLRRTDVFNGLFKKIGGSSSSSERISTIEELEVQQRELVDSETHFFQECQNLDYWRTQLELELQKCMNQYYTMTHYKSRILNKTSLQFSSLLKEAFSTQSNLAPVDTDQEIRRIYNANHGIVGHYVPQPGVVFAKHNQLGELTGVAMFHTDLQELPANQLGVIVLLHILLEYLQGCDAVEVLQAWQLPMDLRRVSRLRRECIAEFKEADGSHSTSLANVLTSKPRPLADVVGLLQSWLLELPDSLIPMICYEEISKTQSIEGMSMAPAEHSVNLAAICDHFGWLVKHCGDNKVRAAFDNRTDFPLYHVFARTRTRNPQDASVVSDVVREILCKEGSAERLRDMAKSANARTDARAEARADLQAGSSTRSSPPPTSRLTTPAVFVPRPLKAAHSDASSSRQSSKRISGLDLAVVGQSDSESESDPKGPHTLTTDLAD